MTAHAVASRRSRLARLAQFASVALVLAAPAAATAAPDKSVALDAAAPEFKWDGEQVQATNFSLAPVISFDPANCTKDSDSYCEQYLLEIRSGVPVKLDASLTGFSSPAADFDLYVYKSTAAGAPGEEVSGGSGTGGAAGADEVWTASEVEPGFYLLVVSHFFNPDATYKGMAKVTGATPVAGGGTTPPPAGGGTPPPPPPASGGSTTPAPSGGGFTTLPFKASATLGSAKQAKKKKSLSFKATAQADISNLVVALVDSKKKVIARVKVASFKKGSRTLKLKVSKLKKGSYTLAAEGVVNGTALKTSQKVKVKA